MCAQDGGVWTSYLKTWIMIYELKNEKVGLAVDRELHW